jgi:UDP-N-acetylmuramate dehydrogenase
VIYPRTGMTFLEQVELAPYTTLGIGGPARWMATVSSEDELVDALEFAARKDLRIFILGGGSNLLVGDAGFEGLVVRIAIMGVEQTANCLRVGAGESWDGFVQYAVDRGLAGVECLAGIPGTVGGTPVQNVGAYGQEVAETIIGVRVFDLKIKKFLELSKEECGFGYRTSLFNLDVAKGGARGRYVVTRVDFCLHPGGTPELKYADLARRFAEGSSPSLAEVAETVRAIRGSKGMVTAPPDDSGKYPMERDADTRSAGSFFRNPVVRGEMLVRIARAVGVAEDKVPNWPAGNGWVKLPAAWLIEQAGFPRGYALGAVGISTRHTLALTNRGGATAAEIAELRDEIARVVRDRFGVSLEQEPVSVS